MTRKTLRVLIPLAILGAAGIAFITNSGMGTLSSFGWRDIAVLCPVGALGTMLASKTAIPRAVISLVLFVGAVILLGRAFCGWICPVPVWSKIRNLFAKQDKNAETERGQRRAAQRAAEASKPLTEKELALLQHGCRKHREHFEPQNSRHLVLGGALLSAAIFGFPVFCLLCPVGLSFAGVFTLILLFGTGDVSLSVIAIPIVLAVEVIFFKRWCSHICPISALMSLVSKFNRTFRPAIDDAKCLETAKGARCGRCASVCEVGIDVRHPQLGTSFDECTRCMECVDHCPGEAITFPLYTKKTEVNALPQELDEAS